MNKGRLFLCLLAVVCHSFTGCNGQQAFGTELLQTVREIPLPEVKGRIDHMDVNLRDQVVYVAALGNNTLEVVDINKGKIIQSIQGLNEPQGVGYITQHQEIFVANGGNGDGYFYDAHTFAKTGVVHLGSDADDVRYDSVENRIYVGYGAGGIATIDAKTHQLIADVKVPAHPESFQVDKKLNLLYVNVPDAKMVGVIDLKQSSLTAKWMRDTLAAIFRWHWTQLHTACL